MSQAWKDQSDRRRAQDTGPELQQALQDGQQQRWVLGSELWELLSPPSPSPLSSVLAWALDIGAASPHTAKRAQRGALPKGTQLAQERPCSSHVPPPHLSVPKAPSSALEVLSLRVKRASQAIPQEPIAHFFSGLDPFLLQNPGPPSTSLGL